ARAGWPARAPSRGRDRPRRGRHGSTVPGPRTGAALARAVAKVGTSSQSHLEDVGDDPPPVSREDAAIHPGARAKVVGVDDGCLAHGRATARTPDAGSSGSTGS